jgi:aminocarboxymuconate-semialdehyde decarboxylase
MTGIAQGFHPERRPAPAQTGGLVFVDCASQPLHGHAHVHAHPAGAGASGADSHAAPKRRKVYVGDRHVRTVDIHAHCSVPDAVALMDGQQTGPRVLRTDLDMASEVALRLSIMDAQGIDIQALSINPNWYRLTDRDLAAKVIEMQNEALAVACGENPDRFVAFASVALQFPELAAEQLEKGVKTYGLRGAAIGGSVAGAEIADPKFNPFWAKAEELGIVVFIHPQPDGAPSELGQRFKGNGYLSNVIGNPLETTIALSHLIFEGTLDRYPGLKICAAHAGGYVPSYIGRFDRGCPTLPEACGGIPYGGIKRLPSDYIKDIYYDTMVFRPEGVRHLAEEVGAGKLVVGTDYPYPWTETAIDLILETPGLSDEERIAILGRTASRLLGIAEETSH